MDAFIGFMAYKTNEINNLNRTLTTMRDGVINYLTKRACGRLHLVIDCTRAAYNNKHSNTTQIILLIISQSYTSKFF